MKFIYIGWLASFLYCTLIVSQEVNESSISEPIEPSLSPLSIETKTGDKDSDYVPETGFKIGIDDLRRYAHIIGICMCTDDKLVKTLECPHYCDTDTINSRKIDMLGICKDDYYEVKSVLIANNVNKELILAFRGTSNLKQLIENISAQPVDYSIEKVELVDNDDDPSIRYKIKDSLNEDDSKITKVHGGFHQLNNVIREKYLPLMFKALNTEKYKNYTVVVTGHSLGGGVANLVSLTLTQTANFTIPKDKIKLVTFAQPRVGDSSFNELLYSKVGLILRVTSQHDPIPRFPPRKLFDFNFTHTHNEIHVVNDPNTYNARGYTLNLCSSDDKRNLFDSLANLIVPDQLKLKSCSNNQSFSTYLAHYYFLDTVFDDYCKPIPEVEDPEFFKKLQYSVSSTDRRIVYQPRPFEIPFLPTNFNNLDMEWWNSTSKLKIPDKQDLYNGTSIEVTDRPGESGFKLENLFGLFDI